MKINRENFGCEECLFCSVIFNSTKDSRMVRLVKLKQIIKSQNEKKRVIQIIIIYLAVHVNKSKIISRYLQIGFTDDYSKLGYLSIIK